MPCLPWRYAIAIVGLFGFASGYAMRVNMSVAIVEMVRNQSSEPPSGHTCPFPDGNNTAPDYNPVIIGVARTLTVSRVTKCSDTMRWRGSLRPSIGLWTIRFCL